MSLKGIIDDLSQLDLQQYCGRYTDTLFSAEGDIPNCLKAILDGLIFFLAVALRITNIMIFELVSSLAKHQDLMFVTLIFLS